MPTTRRKFIQTAALGAFASSTVALPACRGTKKIAAVTQTSSTPPEPLIISTWDYGPPTNGAAWNVVAKGGRALDAVQAGVMVPEGDPKITSVGRGGYPDRDGRVTLDACLMDEFGECGSVCMLEHIVHPIAVARLVKDKTPHVMLVGDGALQFALENGFKKEALLTDQARKAWKEWLVKKEYKPVINFERHDTIGMLALDQHGNLSGACTTSGLAFKMHGRVGDSPIIGAGLFVDNEVGAATSTGLGEYMIKTCSSFLVVELMRQGATPTEACKEAVARIVKKYKNYQEFQAGFIAVNKKGEVGAAAIHPGFVYGVTKKGDYKAVEVASFDTFIPK